MIGLIQRVSSASVRVDDRIVGRIGPGLLAMVGIERDDGRKEADRLLQRIIGYRVFPDDTGRMNRSVSEMGGGLLLVPQFTLAADTRKGMRASFGPAAEPGLGGALFDYLFDQARHTGLPVAAGTFGAHMRVALENDGPVTFILRTPPVAAKSRQRGEG